MTYPSCKSAFAGTILQQGAIAVRRCESYGHVFSTGGPPPQTIYDDAYYVDHYAPRATALTAFFEGEARRLPPPREGARLLDVGSGLGLFLLAAKKQGWTVLGVEPAKAAIAGSRRAGLSLSELHPGPFRDLPLPQATFDAVTFWDALAHIPDLHSTLLEARRLLSPSGTLVIKSPHRPTRMLHLARWLDRLDPRASQALVPIASQVHHFTPGRLAKVLVAQGFTVTSWRWSKEVPHPRPAVRPRALRRALLGLGGLIAGHPSFIMVATPAKIAS